MKKIIIVFDGYCILCSDCVLWIYKKNKLKNIFYTHFESDFIKNNYPNLKLENTVYLVDENGGFLKMSKAIKYCTNFIEMNFILKFFIKITPAFILDIIYRLVSRYRYVISEKDCLLFSQKFTEKPNTNEISDVKN